MLLCLDFDGVLCHSVDECFVTAYSSYYDCEIRLPDQAPSALYRYFLDYRYLVGAAENFYLLFHAFERNLKNLDELGLAQLRNAAEPALDKFGKTFFERREQQKATGFAQWLALHRIYRESMAVLRPDFPGFYVVTTKDRKSVEQIAAHHGYADKMIGIYSKEISSDKLALFRQLFRDTGIDPARKTVCFVDDSRDHLERVRSLGLDCRLAVWGYIAPVATPDLSEVRSLDEFVNIKA
jgi:phosphoglycolate phosphatase-like HAD superfamily hydrolase